MTFGKKLRFQITSALLGLAVNSCCMLRDDHTWVPRLESIVAESNQDSITRDDLKNILGVTEDDFSPIVVGVGEQVTLDSCFELYVEPHVVGIDGVSTMNEYYRLPSRLIPASRIDAITLSRSDGRIIWRHETAAYSREQAIKTKLPYEPMKQKKPNKLEMATPRKPSD